MARKTQVYREDIDEDFIKTAQGRVSFFLAMALFARAGANACAMACSIEVFPHPETKTITLECTFTGCGDWKFYKDVTEDDKRTLLLDMVLKALEVHSENHRFRALWGPRPFTAKDEVAAEMAKLKIGEQ
jgi:hypothetical protein